MGGSGVKLIVGLGNPGHRYSRTRHNVGFEVIDRIARRTRVRVSQRRRRSLTAEVIIAGQEVMLVKPQTYMNLSGAAVADLVERLGLVPLDLIVVYDDADLPTGSIRIRPKGSAGGHKGVKSIIDALGTNEFPRVRIGIGPMRGEGVDYVLSRFSRSERMLTRLSTREAADAIETILSEGIEPAMNKYNRAEQNDQ